MTFKLHPQLARDTFPAASLDLCELLVMNDARYPWCILVPRTAGLSGLHELSAAQQARLLNEVTRVSDALLTEAGVERVNVAALGNIVQQLHIHVVGRWPGDPAWPGPVWGHGQSIPYAATVATELITRVTAFVR